MALALDPSLTLDLDPEAVSFYHESTLVGWDSRLRDHPTQVAARQGVALISKEMKRKDGSVTPAHIPWGCASPSACGMTWMTGPAPHRLPAQ